ncbi:hypothetical protein [Pseudonocardia sp. KRD291]|uniref:hypothetical protein n=1 Tax=Pseudonocardia sp. KRD291 TaxID=2792007 RepID=UPI001C4A6EE8|nr:hypothetical protein [Pseudonocardia sp. KRD291]MBW0104070.1 hypothetical protein [Pseudonocardia sp. KRD291]
MGLLRTFRDANATLRRERDERVELVLLQRERFTWRVAGAAAVIGSVGVLAWPSLADHQRVVGIWWVVALTYVVWTVAQSVARARYGSVATPEMRRADALRSLLLFPVGLAVSGVVYWLVSRDLTGTWIWLVTFGVATGLGLCIRYRSALPSGEEGSPRVSGPG